MTSEAPARIIARIDYNGTDDGLWVDAGIPLPPPYDMREHAEYVRFDIATQFVSVDDMASFLHRDLVVRHHLAARAGDEATRVRLFALIDEIEWAYPNNIPQPPGGPNEP